MMRRIVYFRLFFASVFLVLLAGCCPYDEACCGSTPYCPAQFWDGSAVKECPCDDDIEVDQDLRASEECLQKAQVDIAELIDVALHNNPTTTITWANARAAAYGVGIAESELYPQVNLSEQVNYNYNQFDDDPFGGAPGREASKTSAGASAAHLMQDPILSKFPEHVRRAQALSTTAAATTTASALGSLNIVPGRQTSLISDISISYLLLDFGGRQANIEAAKQALYSSNWIHNRQVQQVMYNVLQTYYNYQGLAALLEARYADLKNSQANYDCASQLFESGLRNKLDVLQAKTNLINNELLIVSLQGQKEVAYGELANALGFPSNARFNVPLLPEEVGADVVKENVDELINMAWDRRPDLYSAYAQHMQAKEEVIIARSAGLPTLGTIVNLEQFNDFSNSNFNNHSLSASLVLSAPLFSGYLYQNQERQAREFVRSACGNLRNVELSISLDVITAYFNFKTAVKSLKFALENLKYSNEAYDAASITYADGISTILDLLLAQQNLSEARAQVIQARTSWAIALSNISFALGTMGSRDELKPWEIRK